MAAYSTRDGFTPTALPKLERIDTPNGRRYQTPEGKLYPSVTTIFSAIPNPHLDAWRARVGETEARRIGNRAAARGTWIHEQCEYYLEGGKKFVKPGDVVSTMLNLPQWKAFRPVVEQIGSVRALEAMLYSNKLELAGTVDCVGEWGGKLSIIDFKTSSRHKTKDEIDTYWMQCAAYAMMWYERTREPITQLVVLMSVEDGEPIVYCENIKSWAHRLLEVRELYRQQTGS